MQRSLVIVTALLLLRMIGYAQPLTGRVTDSTHAPLADVLVTIIRMPGGDVLHFAVTAADGSFRLAAPATDSGTLRLCVRLFGYRLEATPLEPGRTRYDFILTPDATDLPEATVKSNRPRIHSNGDTTTYTAADFTHAQDRTIGDVLRRMPGIDVDNTGKIYYNGKAVSAFYIDGDNLLDDRYNIGTTTIPPQIVDKVQVIENNEPIKVRASRTGGNATVINITLRDAAQHPIDQLALAGGLPNYYDAALNNLLFQHRYKALTQLKGNNTGASYDNDLTSYNQDATNLRTGDPLPDPLVSLAGIAAPPIESRRYRFNHTGILNTNNLLHLGKDWQLKLKVVGLYDHQDASLSNNTTTLLGTTSINYTEGSRSTIRPERLNSGLSLTANTNNFYFSDNFTQQLTDDHEQGSIISNDSGSIQNLHIHLTQFTNELQLIRRLTGNRLVELYSYASTLHYPQTLQVQPQSLQVHPTLDQQISFPCTYTQDYVAFTLPGAISQTYKAGVSYQHQHLNTQLTGQAADSTVFLSTDSTVFLPADSATNNLDWNRWRVFAEAQFDYTDANNTRKASLHLPFSWEDNRILNPSLTQNNRVTHFFFDPQLTLQLSPRSQSALRLHAAFHEDPGTILNFYGGYLLRDFRTLQANTGVYLNYHNQYELSYTLRQSARLLFFNAGIIYSQLSSATIADTRISENFTVLNSTTPPVRTASSLEFNTGFSKYVFHWNSTISANYQYKYVRTNQVANGLFLPFDNYAQSLSIRINTRLPANFDLSYTGILTHLTGRPAQRAGETPDATATTLGQKLQLAWLPRPLLTLKASLEDLLSTTSGATNNNSLFIDALIQYKLTRIHTDLELSATNLAGAGTYRITQLTTNSVSTTSYPLRPRIVLLKGIFNF